ncbi:MAG: hypothetical protein HY711_08640 [Candidatus Melainabacteria bacterium]|nr:hypothetical protein [Candidatus Melainabacteria bacterium]
MKRQVEQPDGNQNRAILNLGYGHSIKTLAAGLFCFVLALTLCLVQNLSRRALGMVLTFDSGHYLGSAQQVYILVKHLIDAGMTGSLKELLTPLGPNLLLDGPILPILVSCVFLVIGKMPGVADGVMLVVLQSILHAASALLVFFLGKQFTGQIKWGLVTGILWASYPSALVGAGKFLPETLITCVLSMQVIVLSQLVRFREAKVKITCLLSFFLGCLTGLVFLLKAALAPAATVIDLLALSVLRTNKRKFVFLSCVLIGMSIFLVPWATFTYVTSGHIHLTPQRMPVLNVVSGLDLEMDGWEPIPQSPLVRMFTERDSPLATEVGLWASNPQKSLNLVLRKLPRLWENPWNDFRSSCLKIPVGIQKWWHQLLCLFAVYAAFLFFCMIPSKASHNQAPSSFIGYASVILILWHLVVYSLFISTPRYAFTAMPFVVLLAGFVLSKVKIRNDLLAILAVILTGALFLALCQTSLTPYLAYCSRHPMILAWLNFAAKLIALLVSLGTATCAARTIGRLKTISSAGKIALVCILAYCLAVMFAFTTYGTSINEWSCKVRPGMSALRKISLSHLRAPDTRKPKWALILLDGDATSTDAVVLVNEKPLSDRPRPIRFYRSSDDGVILSGILANLVRQPEENIRQWRAVQVPVDLLDASPSITISVCSTTHPFTIYGDYPSSLTDALVIPSLTLFSPTKFLSTPDMLDGRLTTMWHNQSLSNALSWLADGSHKEAADLSSCPGIQFGQYRLFLILGYGEDGTPNVLSKDIGLL